MVSSLRVRGQRFGPPLFPCFRWCVCRQRGGVGGSCAIQGVRGRSAGTGETGGPIYVEAMKVVEGVQRVLQRFARGWHPMDLYVRGRYLAAVERVAASRSFFSWIGDLRGGMIVR